MYIEKFHKEVASVMVAMSAALARCQSLGYVNIVHKVGEMYAASLIPEWNMVCVFLCKYHTQPPFRFVPSTWNLVNTVGCYINVLIFPINLKI